MSVTVDNYTRVMLTAIAVLLLFVGVGLWFESPSTVQQAQAKIPDQGEQLNTMILKIEELNKNVSELKGLMVSGKMKVQVVTNESTKKVRSAK